MPDDVSKPADASFSSAAATAAAAGEVRVTVKVAAGGEVGVTVTDRPATHAESDAMSRAHTSARDMLDAHKSVILGKMVESVGTDAQAAKRSVPDLMSDACPAFCSTFLFGVSVRPLNACPPVGPEALQACSLFQGTKAWLEPRLEPAEKASRRSVSSRSAVLATNRIVSL